MKRRDFLTRSSVAVAGAAHGNLVMNAQEPDDTSMAGYQLTGAKLITGSTPAEGGFHFPAEWEKHESTIMVMPTAKRWKGFGIPMQRVRDQWADVANQLAEYEPVLMVVDPTEYRHAKRLLDSSIELVEMPVDDGWSRDTGPMFVVNKEGERRVAGFTFNGWGGKFSHKEDALLKARLCKHLGFPMYPIDLCLEGGAVSVDGEGTILTTEQCLLNPNRNSVAEQHTIERQLNESLGTRKTIWLGKGLEPDPVTDGHVDGIAAFAEPGTVLLHTTTDRGDPNFQDLPRREGSIEANRLTQRGDPLRSSTSRSTEKSRI